MQDPPKFDRHTYFLGAMFHVRDGLFIQKTDVRTQTYNTLIDGPYRADDQHYLFRYPKILFHKGAAKSVCHIKDGQVITDNLTLAETITEIDYNSLASIMASMSMRGETTETFNEALAFLKKLPTEQPNEQN